MREPFRRSRPRGPARLGFHCVKSPRFRNARRALPAAIGSARRHNGGVSLLISINVVVLKFNKYGICNSIRNYLIVAICLGG